MYTSPTFFQVRCACRQVSSPVVTGSVALTLQPRALEYIALRIQALEQLEHLRNSSPVEYLQARVATLQDYSAVERLRQPLARVRHLVLTSLHAPLRYEELSMGLYA